MDEAINGLVEALKGKTVGEIQSLIEASDQGPAVENPALLAVYLDALVNG